MTTEDRKYSLEELNEAKAQAAKAALAREKAQRENFIPKEEHEALLDELNTFKAQKAEAEILPKVKEAYEKAGGNTEAFNDFYALNKDTLRLDNDDTLAKSINEVKETKGYLFNSTNEQVEETPKEEAGKAVYAEGSLQRIK